MEYDVRDFAHNLKRIRDRRHMKQTVLSQLAGLDENAVRLYEMGLRIPTLTSLIALADALDVTVEELIRHPC